MVIIRDADVAMYRFSVGDLEEDELRLLSFRGREGLSELFRFELELVSRTRDLSFARVVGQPAVLSILSGEEPRHVSGMVSRFEQGPVSGGFTHYSVELVPRVWTLQHRVDSRIFQNASVPDLIDHVLKSADVPGDAFRLELSESYAEREYCVQYNESDWAFLSRLMEQEGLFYFFEHAEDDHVLVVGDATSVHQAIPGEAQVPFVAGSDLDSDERDSVDVFNYAEQVRIGAVELRDYNFKRPKANMEARQRASEGRELELYEYPGDYHDVAVGKRRARARLEEQQAEAAVACGHGFVSRFTPGYHFELEGHYRKDFDRRYLLTRVEHAGREPAALEEEAAEDSGAEYANDFRCMPADVPFRPPRRTPWPFIRGTQSATVVGEGDDEIYTDEYGRVLVLFHWERASEKSCWIRVSQPWAGAGYGFLWIPRVGQEVVVAFHEGSPDQPHIIGRVYNADQTPPYELPAHKTTSTIKTASSKGAEGANELRFEDRKGEERLFLQAERDLAQRAKNDALEWVGRDRHLVVKRDQKEHVKVDRHETIDRDHHEEIGRDRHSRVKGKEAKRVGGSRSLTVQGDVTEVFRANHSEEVTQNYYLKGMGLVLESMTGITLKCGGSSVVIDPSGVTLSGPMAVIDGSMVRIASGPGSPAGRGKAGRAVSPVAPEAAKEATLADPGRASEAKGEEEELEPFRPEEASEDGSWIEIELVDEEGDPVPGERYAIVLPDGKTVAEGTLDENGFARVEGIDRGQCRVSFPNLARGSEAGG